MKRQQMKWSMPIPIKGIRHSMIFFFSVLILCAVFVFLGISIRLTQDTVLENSAAYTKQLIKQVNADIDAYITSMENISTILVTNMDVREYLSDTNLDAEREKILKQRIYFQFETIFHMRDDISNLAILGENGRVILNLGNDEINPNIQLNQMYWYKRAVEEKGEGVLSSSHVQNMVYDDYRWVVSLSKAIRTKENNETLGALLVDLNYSSITNLCQNIDIGNKGYIFIIDEQGEIIYHPKQQLIYTGLKSENIAEILACKEESFTAKADGDEKLYTMATAEKTGWTLVGVANIKELFPTRRETQSVYSICAFFLFLTAVGVAILYSDKLTKPITELRNSMKEVEKGNFQGSQLPYNENNEIGMLRKSFNIMISKIQNLMDDNIKAQKEKYRLELKALQSQMNPHFLYNTLDSIIWMAESSRDKEVVIMTSSLAKLLRQSISNEEEFVTVEQEAGYVRSYLTIQKMRYGDELSYEIDIDASISSAPIIKLILQPLVENSIYHGIKYNDSNGMILIKGFRDEENIVLQVIDNGIGMNEETLMHIFDKKESSGKNNGVAVENVNRRIKLCYGNDYGLEYESKVNIGTIVTIKLPDQKE